MNSNDVSRYVNTILPELRKKSFVILCVRDKNPMVESTLQDFINIFENEGLKYSPLFIDSALDIISEEVINKLKQGDVICKIVHGQTNRTGIIQGILDALNKPFTGHTLMTDQLSQDKIVVKHIMKSLNIPTPEHLELCSTSADNVVANLKQNKQYILKPAGTNSSIGIILPKDHSELIREIINIKQNGLNNYLMEDFIKGRVITIGVIPIGNQRYATKPMEYIFYESAGFMDEEWKDNPVRVFPNDLSDRTVRRAQDYAKQLHIAIGAKGVTRTDFIIDDQNDSLYTLEINSNVGLSMKNDVPLAANASQVSYRELVLSYLGTSLK